MIGTNEDERIMICAHFGVIAEPRTKSSKSLQQLFPHHLFSSVTSWGPPGTPEETQQSNCTRVLLREFDKTEMLIKINYGWDWKRELWKETVAEESCRLGSESHRWHPNKHEYMLIKYSDTADHVHGVKRNSRTKTKRAGPFNRNCCVPINENPRAINVYWSVPGANCGISQQARALGGERGCGLSVFFKRSISIVHNPCSALRSSNLSQRPLAFASKAPPAVRTLQYLSR